MPSVAEIHDLLIRSVIDYAIFMLDPGGRVVSWNPGAERIKGYAAEDIIGDHFSCFYTESERCAGVPARTLRIAEEEGRFAAEGWRVRKDGTRFWATVVIDAIFQDGKLAGFAKITRDLTDQRTSQLAMLETERRFRLLVQSVTDYAIFMLDQQGNVTNWNTGAARIKGYTAPEIIGTHFSRFYTPEDRAAGMPDRALKQAERTGRYESEGWRCRKDGTRFWASVVLDAVHDDDGQPIGFAKVTRDLTERRKIELELEESREQLFQAQKMEAVGHLTGGLAHDFNNLLTGITGSLDLLRTRLSQGRVDDLERYIVAAQGASARAAGLTHRLLAFARRQTLDPKPTDANVLIADMVEMLQRTVGPEIGIETAFGDGLWQTLCDPNQLENVILNVCINARDAMPDGGRIVVETTNETLNARAARDSGLKPGPYVVIGIRDTGSGMAPDVLARAFDPFYTTKPTGRGTGLGLSMVYGFARQSNGQVRLFSEVGKGTTVRLYLPWHPDAAERPEDGAGPGLGDAAQASAGETVLVVDDEPSIRMLVAEILNDLGYSVLEAEDGVSGLEILRSNARIDLLISDVGLPGGLNGRQMADAARVFRPGLKVLFITGYAENAAVGNTSLEPGMHVLTKPFAMDRLAARIQAIIADW